MDKENNKPKIPRSVLKIGIVACILAEVIVVFLFIYNNTKHDTNPDNIKEVVAPIPKDTQEYYENISDHEPTLSETEEKADLESYEECVYIENYNVLGANDIPAEGIYVFRFFLDEYISAATFNEDTIWTIQIDENSFKETNLYITFNLTVVEMETTIECSYFKPTSKYTFKCELLDNPDIPVQDTIVIE